MQYIMRRFDGLTVVEDIVRSIDNHCGFLVWRDWTGLLLLLNDILLRHNCRLLLFLMLMLFLIVSTGGGIRRLLLSRHVLWIGLMRH